MKRYTGQQALYEAISRSRARAERRSIIERLRPETTPPEQPAPVEGLSQIELVEAPVEEPRPAAKEPPAPEKPREPALIREDVKRRWLAAMKKEEVREKPEPPVPQRRSVEPAKDDPPAQVHRPWRVRPLQVNAGRIELSVPYHMGIVAALVVILVILATFRVGQKYPGTPLASAASTKSPAATVRPNAAETRVERTPSPERSASAPTVGQPAMPQGDHWIVLAQHKNEADLAPVVEYFGKAGVELRVYQLGRTRQLFIENGLNVANLPSGDGYLLATTYLYSNPDRPGTDGYEIKQKIIELGKTYKAPAGRETFAARRFSDAYGMKIR